MRQFEILLLIGLALVAILSLLPWRPGRRWPAILLLSLLGLQLALERPRWQMIPAYLLLPLVIWLSNRPPLVNRRQRFLRGFILLIGLLAAVTLPLVLPVPRFPEPTGAYDVGTRVYHLVDPRRPETIGAVPGARRELMLQIWYPAEPTGSEREAPYLNHLDIVAPHLARQVGLPAFLLQHLHLVQTGVFQDAPAAAGPWPVILFSHGLGGVRTQNSFLVRELVSHGYVVAAVDHTFAAAITVFPDGEVALYNPAVLTRAETAVDGGRQLMMIWSADLAFVLDKLTEFQGEPTHPLGGRLSLDSVGIAGQSTGGGTAVIFCATDPRCDAGLGLDAWVAPVPEEAGLVRPFMFISSPTWLSPENSARGQGLYRNGTADAYQLNLAGTRHFDFTDLPLLSPAASFLGISGENGRAGLLTINQYSMAFFDQYLKNQPSVLLTESAQERPALQFEYQPPTN